MDSKVVITDLAANLDTVQQEMLSIRECIGFNKGTGFALEYFSDKVSAEVLLGFMNASIKANINKEV